LFGALIRTPGAEGPREFDNLAIGPSWTLPRSGGGPEGTSGAAAGNLSGRTNFSFYINGLASISIPTVPVH